MASDTGLAEVRLICLAGSERELQQFRSWAPQLSEHIELLTAEVSRHVDGQRVLDSETLLIRLDPFLRKPHALFSLTTSGPVAYTIARHAQWHHPGRTRHLFLLGCQPPRPAEPVLKMPVTALQITGDSAWQNFSHHALELIELPSPSADLQQRLVHILNTHLGLLDL